ncbi:uncharacterized protein [Physcomitrium patens]|uniref:uncharacterized protein isoform X1 n=1 Tax=Physcomitrium patens TaxID=3218 RepID=UPI000D15BF6E|nr:uncharacterized protein LOC112272679 [Physcomitrium patens]|eukprot:XP_024356449.1 uncharacterized protein LOC112272679 [Physcomitrella patens]
MVYLFRGYRQSIGICFLIRFEDVLLCFCPCFIGTVRHSPSVKAYSPCRQSRVYESAIVVSAMLATRCGQSRCWEGGFGGGGKEKRWMRRVGWKTGTGWKSESGNGSGRD